VAELHEALKELEEEMKAAAEASLCAAHIAFGMKRKKKLQHVSIELCL